MAQQAAEAHKVYDWEKIVDDLNKYLKLKAIPIGMKMFADKEEMESIPKIRRSKGYLVDQIVAQAARLGWTVGVTADDLGFTQCGAIIGLYPQDEKWLAGEPMAGVWFETKADSAAHQRALDVVPYGKYQAMAVAPLASGRLNPPDICLIYGTPGQMILLINGLQWAGYKKFEWSVVGESACADSWGRALATGEPSLSIPCYAERRYGGVLDDELLMAMPPEYLLKCIDGLERLSKNGLRYPIPSYGIQGSPKEALAPIYPSWVRGNEASGAD
jgi:uncharacterized protein (DUF169 family)